MPRPTRPTFCPGCRQNRDGLFMPDKRRGGLYVCVDCGKGAFTDQSGTFHGRIINQNAVMVSPFSGVCPNSGCSEAIIAGRTRIVKCHASGAWQCLDCASPLPLAFAGQPRLWIYRGGQRNPPKCLLCLESGEAGDAFTTTPKFGWCHSECFDAYRDDPIPLKANEGQMERGWTSVSGDQEDTGSTTQRSTAATDGEDLAAALLATLSVTDSESATASTSSATAASSERSVVLVH